jgi:hypothetical protein
MCIDISSRTQQIPCDLAQTISDRKGCTVCDWKYRKHITVLINGSQGKAKVTTYELKYNATKLTEGISGPG